MTISAPWRALPRRRRPDAETVGFKDRAWILAVGGLDEVLRWYHNVHEYSCEPGCVFRIGLERAQYPVVLGDGTLIEAGETVGTLHYWNEHLLRYPGRGPDLHWAKAMQRRVQHSLEALCRYVEQDSQWATVNAIRAETPLALRPRAQRQLAQLAERHGFELGQGQGLERGRVSVAMRNMLLWGFARAYNPAALSGHCLLQGRKELWLSRASLLARFSATSGQAEAKAEPSIAA